MCHKFKNRNKLILICFYELFRKTMTQKLNLQVPKSKAFSSFTLLFYHKNKDNLVLNIKDCKLIKGRRHSRGKVRKTGCSWLWDEGADQGEGPMKEEWAAWKGGRGHRMEPQTYNHNVS